MAIPLENAFLAGDRVVVSNVEASQVNGMAEFEEGNSAFWELDDIQPVILQRR